MVSNLTRLISRLLQLTSLSVVLASPVAQAQGIYTVDQVVSGERIYKRDCAVCHGDNLAGGEAGTSLVGPTFLDKWVGQSLSELYEITRSTMPLANPGGLSETAYHELVAYMLYSNGYSFSNHEMTGGLAMMENIELIRPDGGQNDLLSTLEQAPIAGNDLQQQWPYVRADAGNSNYSPLELINSENVENLEVAWRWKSENFGASAEYNFQSTPLMVDGVLYTTAGMRRTAVAIDASTGETLWMHRLDEGKRGENAPRKGSGRGVTYGFVEGQPCIFYITPGYQLVGLDAKTGRPLANFGSEGVVDLKQDLDQDVDLVNTPIGASSPPVLVNGVVIVGAAFGPGAAPTTPQMITGHIRGFDAVTGKRRWVFHTIPQEHEEGVETWLKDSWRYTGNTGAWAPLSADAELDMVYIPVEAATGDFYGGHRPGDNLYSQSLVALNASTGEKVWHFQMIHHGLWDYDPPAPPLLFDMAKDNERIPVVAQLSKQGFVYTFDRRDGTPIWPIEERPVPSSSIKSEWTSPTQPFPTKPEPYAPQGMTEKLLNDLTPEILAESKRIAEKYTMGPLYTPPTLITDENRGTLLMPGAGGGANWQGGVVDLETGILYVSASHGTWSIGLGKSDKSSMDLVALRHKLEGPFGLPLTKPPYGTITAIDMNSGDHLWRTVNGPTPEAIANHPLLAGVDLPATGHDERAGLLVTASLLFAGEGSGLYIASGGGRMFRAHDKESGSVIWEFELPANQTGLPMTYALDGQQFIVIPVGGNGLPGELIALKLP